MKNRALACLTVGLAILLSACGGGGGGGSSGSTTTTAPYIEAQVLSFPAGQVPSGYAQSGFNSAASVWVTDKIGGSPITNATVSINGVALSYVAADQAYEAAAINVAPGEAVTLSVTVGGTTYTATATQYSAYPTITIPTSGATWSSSAANIIGWSGVAPTADSIYAVAVTDTDGNLIWPSNGGFMDVSSSSTLTIADSGSLTAGNLLVVVGLERGIDIPGTASNSILVIGGFNYAPITVTNGATTSLASVAVTPNSATVANGQTRQMTATGTYSNSTTQDLTTQVTWSSSDPSKATVSSTGLVTGVAYGSATITATSGAVSNSMTIIVFQPTSSPTPPLSQAVAYQIDYAHSGRAVFADAVTFPTTTPAWSVTLNGTISYPLIVGGRVFVTTYDPIEHEKKVYALDQITGATIWGPISITGTYSFGGGHAYDNGRLFVVTYNGLLSSLDPTNGQSVWSRQLPGQTSFTSPPTAANGIVYVAGAGSGGTLYAVDESSGNVMWTASVMGGLDSSPTVSGDGVFVSYDCQAYKFDLYTGAPLWHYSGGCSGGGGDTAVYANGRLYRRDATLQQPKGQAFNATNGTLLGTFSATQAPAFTTQTGFFLNNGTLTGVNLSSGSVLWTFTGDGGLILAPVAINDKVAVVSSSGTAYALDVTTGAQAWSGAVGSTVPTGTFGGIGAGEGYLVVPAGSRLTAWRITGP